MTNHQSQWAHKIERRHAQPDAQSLLISCVQNAHLATSITLRLPLRDLSYRAALYWRFFVRRHL